MKKLTALMGITIFLLSGCTQESVSLGVIGGADGPTAVFVSAAPFWWVTPLILAVLLVGAAVILGKWMKNRKKR